MPVDDDRLALAASSWPRCSRSATSARGPGADTVGRSAGIVRQQLEQAVRNAVRAALVDRRVDDDGALVLLIGRGRRAEESAGKGGGSGATSWTD
jgi:hypothetical protein